MPRKAALRRERFTRICDMPKAGVKTSRCPIESTQPLYYPRHKQPDGRLPPRVETNRGPDQNFGQRVAAVVAASLPD